MRLLAIESSTEWLSVAAGDGTHWHEHRERAGQTHSERVLPLVETVLAEARWSLADLDAIAFGAGPGSFTGVRIACGVAQGLALGVDCPLIPVSTLEAVAEECWQRHRATRVFACLDARMREVYVGAFVRESDHWRERMPAAVVRPVEIAVPEGEWLGAGDGLAAYPAIAEALPFASRDPTVVPTARAIGTLARSALTEGRVVPPEQAAPLYVRQRVALTTAEREAGLTL